MSTPFLGELKVVSFNFAPKGWALCNGQLLPINQNQALFSLLGTTYGGNGQTNFALPNLQGRVPAHFGVGSYTQGATFGEYSHTITTSELPQHNHFAQASSQPATTNNPAAAVYADTSAVQGLNAYKTGASGFTMNPATVSNIGGSQPHENRMPFLAINFIISLSGIFPSQN